MRRIACIALLAVLAVSVRADAQDNHAAVVEKLNNGVWNSKRAMGDIANLLSFGARAPDTPGHELALQYIEHEMHKTKAKDIKAQQWVDGTETGLLNRVIGSARPHTMANVIARLNPENPRRIIVGTHYDSIIRAYADKKAPKGPMPGANNSASGVALLLETARAMSQLPPSPVGIDFVFFDGEEGPLSLGAGDPNWRAIGSPYFAQHIADTYPDEKPEQAILFDMVCYKKMKLKPEPLSLAAAKEQVDRFWEVGAKYAPEAFVKDAYTYPIDDDHDALNKIGIPSFLVIGFEYAPYFNTTQDTIDKCSGANLKAVGNALLDYIYSIPPKP